MSSKTRLPIISADQRMSEKSGIKGCILGRAGIGKTSLLWTLDSSSTLFIDLEAGDLAVRGWEGDAIRPKTWEQCRDLAVFLGGYNPALTSDKPYSRAHYDAVCSKFGDISALNKYQTIFIDSITVAGRLCLQWCRNQPQSYSEKTGKEDMRAAYGLHGQEMIGWITHLQHMRSKDVWFVAVLDEKLDDYGQKVFSVQIDGSKTANELPAIVDQLITMAEVEHEEGRVKDISSRAFINHTVNPFGYPAKDRSGALELFERPHLSDLMKKIRKYSKSNKSKIINTKNINQNTGVSQ